MRTSIWNRIQNAIQCWIGIHHIPQTSAVMTMGAVFTGGMCTRCFKVKVGPFLCNYWDESQTVKKDNIIELKGINPLLISGEYFVMDLEALEEVAAEKRAEVKNKNSEEEAGF